MTTEVSELLALAVTGVACIFFFRTPRILLLALISLWLLASAGYWKAYLSILPMSEWLIDWNHEWSRFVVLEFTSCSYIAFLYFYAKSQKRGYLAMMLSATLIFLFSLVLAANLGVAFIESHLLWNASFSEIPLAEFVFGSFAALMAGVVCVLLVRRRHVAPYAGMVYCIILPGLIWLCSSATTGGDLRQDFQQFLCFYFFAFPHCAWATGEPAWEFAWYAKSTSLLIPLFVLCAFLALTNSRSPNKVVEV